MQHQATKETVEMVVNLIQAVKPRLRCLAGRGLRPPSFIQPRTFPPSPPITTTTTCFTTLLLFLASLLLTAPIPTLASHAQGPEDAASLFDDLDLSPPSRLIPDSLADGMDWDATANDRVGDVDELEMGVGGEGLWRDDETGEGHWREVGEVDGSYQLVPLQGEGVPGDVWEKGLDDLTKDSQKAQQGDGKDDGASAWFGDAGDVGGRKDMMVKDLPQRIYDNSITSLRGTTTRHSLAPSSTQFTKPGSPECVRVAGKYDACAPLSTDRFLNLTAISNYYNQVDGGNGTVIPRLRNVALDSAEAWNALIKNMTTGTADVWKMYLLPQLPCIDEEPTAPEVSDISRIDVRYLRTFLCTRDIVILSEGCNPPPPPPPPPPPLIPPLADPTRTCPKDQSWCNDFIHSMATALRSHKKGPSTDASLSSPSPRCRFRYGSAAIELIGDQCRRLASVPAVFGDRDVERPARFVTDRVAGERERWTSGKTLSPLLRSPQLSALKVRLPQVASCGLGVDDDFRTCGFISYESPLTAKKSFCEENPTAVCCTISNPTPEKLPIQRQSTLSIENTTDAAPKPQVKPLTIILSAIAGMVGLTAIGTILFIIMRRRHQIAMGYGPGTRGLPRGKVSGKVRLGSVSSGGGGAAKLPSPNATLGFSTMGSSTMLFGTRDPSRSSLVSPSLGSSFFGGEDGKVVALHLVVHRYSAKLPDEMELAKDDVVEITTRYDDGWCRGYNMKTRVTGMFPMACVKPFNPDSGSTAVGS
ncbi:hypothetical protein HDU67_009682 [Dinochytrium kinnereticum]|nr:hypothetical protein HDU67_009682 [Dinochytrium kinnereticum]